MKARLQSFLHILLLSLLPTLLIWIPFFFRIEKVWGIPLPSEGMATIVANYDGPMFLVVAKTLYNPDLVGNFAFPLPNEYYPAHFPLFPLLVRTFAPVFGYPYAMLLVTLVSSLLAIYFFKKFIATIVKGEDVAWMTLVFALFPARWLIVRSVGSSEPLFVAGVIASVHYFRQKKYLLAGIWGAIATVTKSPGILLFASYGAIFVVRLIQHIAASSLPKNSNQKVFKPFTYLPLTLIPLALVGVFYFYKIQTGDFLAYFHSGDNIHLFFPPFQIFNYSQPWVGTFWLEEVLFIYLLGALGVMRLIKKNQVTLAWFTGIFFISLIFVSHRDLLRYALPIIPFLLAGFADVITKKEFKFAFYLLLIPIYLYSLVYISQNVTPVADWAPLL